MQQVIKIINSVGCAGQSCSGEKPQLVIFDHSSSGYYCVSCALKNQQIYRQCYPYGKHCLSLKDFGKQVQRDSKQYSRIRAQGKLKQGRSEQQLIADCQAAAQFWSNDIKDRVQQFAGKVAAKLQSLMTQSKSIFTNQQFQSILQQYKALRAGQLALKDGLKAAIYRLLSETRIVLVEKQASLIMHPVIEIRQKLSNQQLRLAQMRQLVDNFFESLNQEISQCKERVCAQLKVIY